MTVLCELSGSKSISREFRSDAVDCTLEIHILVGMVTRSEIVLCVTFQRQVVTLYCSGFAVFTRMQADVSSLI